jgi:hypothetical protein
MSEKEDFDKGAVTVKIVLTVQKESYELIEGISEKLGMNPPSWVEHVISTKLKREAL